MYVDLSVCMYAHIYICMAVWTYICTYSHKYGDTPRLQEQNLRGYSGSSYADDSSAPLAGHSGEILMLSAAMEPAHWVKLPSKPALDGGI